MGETSRTLYERGKEHWRGFYSKSENSHIYKHHQIHHDGIGEPSFLLRPIRFFTTALTRQIAEATRIQRLGEEIVLNSKAEYNRCKIGRLTIGEDVDDENKFKKNIEKHGQDEEELEEGVGEENIKTWERTKVLDRRLQEIQTSGSLRRGVSISPSRKRTGEEKASKKKRKFPLLGENWGEDMVGEQPPPPPPPPPHPGVQCGENKVGRIPPLKVGCTNFEIGCMLCRLIYL